MMTPPVTPLRAFIGLGSNLGESRILLNQAVEQINALSCVKVKAVSSWYQSAPIGYVDQPDFINGVVCVETTLSADALLTALQTIEHRLGRVRSFQDAPRTVDLDLLLYGEFCYDDARLTVPHPRMHERAFVLAPLLELDPVCWIPNRGAAQTWRARCADQVLSKLERLDERIHHHA